MAGSRRVQSARSNATFLLARSASTWLSAKVVFLLYWQVTHQAAVKSTKTACPLACNCSTRPASQACQPVLVVCQDGFNAPLVAFYLRSKGWRDVGFLAGGLRAWKFFNPELYEKHCGRGIAAL